MSLDSLSFKIKAGDPGFRLISLLTEKIRNLYSSGDIKTVKEVCDLIGITPSHLTLLRNGGADPRKLSNDKMESFAKFLDLPSIAIRFLSDQISIENFYSHGNVTGFKTEVQDAIDIISNDNTWGALLPSDIYTVSSSMKLYIIRMYEEVIGTKLISEGVNLGDLINPSPKNI